MPEPISSRPAGSSFLPDATRSEDAEQHASMPPATACTAREASLTSQAGTTTPAVQRLVEELSPVSSRPPSIADAVLANAVGLAGTAVTCIASVTTASVLGAVGCATAVAVIVRKIDEHIDAQTREIALRETSDVCRGHGTTPLVTADGKVACGRR